MKTKLHAGAELDFLTAKELEDVLQNWRTELTRGAKLRRYSISGAATAGGALEIGANIDGPAQGMVWSITRLSVALPTGAALATAGLQVYANTVSPSSLLIGQLTIADVFPGDHGVFLHGGDSLRIAGAGITASAVITVTLGIKEVPEMMAWSL